MTKRRLTKRRDFLKLSAAATAATVAAACAPATTTAGGSSSAPAGPKTDVSVLTVGLPDIGKQNWRPWLAASQEQAITQHIGDHLIEGDATGALKPGLAESFTPSADYKTWTFKLRPNVPFHDGWGTVTAEDVRFTFEQLLRPDSTYGAGALVIKQAVDGDFNKNFIIVSPLEFRMQTTKPTIHLATAVSTMRPGVVIQSKKYWTEQPAKAEVHPVGTGPYKFISSTPGVEVKLEALPTHWRKTSAFKAVTVKIVPDAAARMAQVQSGVLDLAPLPPALAREAKKNNMQLFGLKDVGSMNVILGGQFPGDPKFPNAEDKESPWIQAAAPEKGLAVRQAMSLAIDRKSILDSLLAGQGTPTAGPMFQYPSNPLLSDPSWKVPAFDVALAKQRLAAGGFPNGFPLTMMVYENSPGTGSADVAEAVAGMWEAIGLKVTRKVSEQAIERVKSQQRNTPRETYVRTTPWFAEPADAAQSTLVPTATPAVFFDPVVTDGVARMNAEFDRTKRFAIAREVIGKLIDSVRAIPICTINVAYCASTKVGGWTPTAYQPNLTGLETVAPKNP